MGHYDASNDAAHFAEFLERGVILRDGAGDIDLGSEDPVHIAIVMDVSGYGPHEAAIYVDQNRFHASPDSALQEAYGILEQYWWDNYQEHYDELVRDHGQQEVDDFGMFTDTFDALLWTLSPAEAAAAIRGTDAEKFVSIEEAEVEDDDRFTASTSRSAASKRTHPDVEFAVDDASGQQRTFKTFDEAAGLAVVIAATHGEPVNIDVLVWSEAGAHFYGGEDEVATYLEDPEASVFERIEVRADAQGRIP